MSTALRSSEAEAGEESSSLKLLAVVLILFSLLVISYSTFTDHKEQQRRSPGTIHQTKMKLIKEMPVKVIVLPEPKEEQPVSQPNGVQQKQVEKHFSKGHMPAIDASFAMPVQEYITILEQRTGAKLILFDIRHRRIAGLIKHEHFTASSIALKTMSMRTRNITLDLNQSFRKRMLSEAHLSGEPIKFLIMLPASAEQQFERILASFIGSQGLDWQHTGSISLQYGLRGGDIYADIKNVNIKGISHRIGKSIKVW